MNWFRLQIVRFAVWLQESARKLLERFDRCSYPGCEEIADVWCVSGNHRHCLNHESYFYADENFCQACRDSMSPEDVAREIRECGSDVL